MAKMTIGSLKSLVKECLFEILLEATEAPEETLSENVRSRKRRSTKKTSPKHRRPALDMISMAPQEKPSPREVDVSGLTSDPVMAAIFQDTATTTLVEQARAERGKPSAAPADAAALKVAQSEPSELFGAASQNWAALAFDE